MISFKPLKNNPIQIREHLWIQFFNINDSPEELDYEQHHPSHSKPFEPHNPIQVVTFNIIFKIFKKSHGVSISNGEIVCNANSRQFPLTFYDNSRSDTDNEIRGQKRPRVSDIIIGLDGVDDVLNKWVENARENSLRQRQKQYLFIRLVQKEITLIVIAVMSQIKVDYSSNSKTYKLYQRIINSLVNQFEAHHKSYSLPSDKWKMIADELDNGVNWSNFSSKSVKISHRIVNKINRVIGGKK